MKEDKRLRKYAEERMSVLGNENFLKILKSKVPAKDKLSLRKKSLIAALSGVAVTAVAVTTVLCVALSGNGENPHGGKDGLLYTVSEADFESSTAEALNRETRAIDFYFNASDDLSVTRYFDKETGKTKYYIANVSRTITGEKFTICTVAAGYEYRCTIDTDMLTKSVTIDTVDVRYDYEYFEEGSGFKYQYQAVINTDTEKIYLWYEACQQGEYDGFPVFAASLFR